MPLPAANGLGFAGQLDLFHALFSRADEGKQDREVIRAGQSQFKIPDMTGLGLR